jgi:uncharacterized lipoprotein NlpE involved in copper resistance
MKTKIFIIVCTFVLFQICVVQLQDKLYDTQNSLNYTGILRCAHCEGIETFITLYADTLYTVQIKYIGKRGETL